MRGGSQRTLTFEGFNKFVRGYMTRTQRPRLSELTAAMELAGPAPAGDTGKVDTPGMDLELLKSALDVDPETGRSSNEPSIAGSDIVGYRRTDDHIVYVDDKAWVASKDNRGEVDRVSAMTKHLAENRADDAKALRQSFDAAEKAGLSVDAKHARVPERLEACALELKKKFPNGIDFRRPGDAAKLARIVAKHKIELAVTSAAGRDITGVSDTLKKAGFRFLKTATSEMDSDLDP